MRTLCRFLLLLDALLKLACEIVPGPEASRLDDVTAEARPRGNEAGTIDAKEEKADIPIKIGDRR